jgi:DNA-directed RNA polymerase subunit RPC12/RpoP
MKKCLQCGKEMKSVKTIHEGIEADAYRCPSCKMTIFTQEQALIFGRKLQQKLFKEKYVKKPIKIGHSYGVIFPRDIVKAFNLDSDQTRFDVKMDISKGKIEITVL